jgi:hypothetical protein
MQSAGASELLIVVIVIGSILFSLVVTIVPLVLVFKYLSNMSGKRQALLHQGMPAQARIVQMGQTGTTINDNPMVRFVFEVHPQPVPGYRQAMPPFTTQAEILVPMIALARVSPGAMVPVRFNPQNQGEITIDFAQMGFM